jgi:hypothetical protein
MCHQEHISSQIAVFRLPNNRCMIFLAYLPNESIDSVRHLLGRPVLTISGLQQSMRGCILSSGTSFLPDIPLPIGPTNSLLLSQFPYLRTCYSLVIAIVPLPNVFRDLYIGFCADVGIRMRAFLLPRKLHPTTKVEEFERFLGALSWGYIAYSVSDADVGGGSPTCAQASVGRSGDHRQPTLFLLREFSSLRLQSMAVRLCRYAAHSVTILFHHGGQ